MVLRDCDGNRETRTLIVAALARALRDRNDNVRWYAAEALGDQGEESKAAVPALTAALKDASPRVAIRAAGALLRVGVETELALAAILSALTGRDDGVRASAADELWYFGLVDPSAPVCNEADAEMNYEEARHFWAKQRRCDSFHPYNRRKWPRDLMSALRPLIEALKDDSELVVSRACSALATMGPDAKEAVPALIEVLNLPSGGWAAAQALGAIGPDARSASLPLILTLNSKDFNARNWAAWALGFISPPVESAVPDLIKALKDDEDGVRCNAAEALGRIGPEAKPAVLALIEALSDKSYGVPSHAAEALGRIGSETAVPALIEALKNYDWDTRREAATALGQIGSVVPTIVLALIEALKDDVARAAAQALGRFGPEAMAAVPALVEVLQNHESQNMRDAAREALRKIDPQTFASLGSSCPSGPNNNSAVNGERSMRKEDLVSELRGDIHRSLSFLGHRQSPGIYLIGCGAGSNGRLALWEEALKADLDEGLWLMGMSYMTGIYSPEESGTYTHYLEKNVRLSEELLRTAANRGFGPALLGLAFLYMASNPKKLIEAVKCFSEAAAQGSIYAQSFLGDHYREGVGVRQDHLKGSSG